MNVKTAENVELIVDLDYLMYENGLDKNGQNMIVPVMVHKTIRVTDIMQNPGFFRYLHTDGVIEDIPMDSIKHMQSKKAHVLAVVK